MTEENILLSGIGAEDNISTQMFHFTYGREPDAEEVACAVGKDARCA